MKKLKTVLISQPAPESEKNPYADLAKQCNLKIDFRPFIHVEGVHVQEIRKTRINPMDYGSVILTSKTAADHYFRVCKEMRMEVPDSMKYFCVSEAIANYLQKYVVYRKRKIFFGKLRFADLIDVLKKHAEEKFLLPTSDSLKANIPMLLKDAGIDYTRCVMYRTVCSDLSDLADVKYDLLVFFSPSGIKSLFQNFPGFTQNGTCIAAFGPSTHKAVKENGLTLDIEVPSAESPSMTMAIAKYIKEHCSNKKK